MSKPYERSVQEQYNADAARIARLKEVNAKLVEALEKALCTIEDYINYKHDGDPWTEDARAMGEMDINDYARDGRMSQARAALAEYEKGKGHE